MADIIKFPGKDGGGDGSATADISPGIIVLRAAETIKEYADQSATLNKVLVLLMKDDWPGDPERLHFIGWRGNMTMLEAIAWLETFKKSYQDDMFSDSEGPDASA